MIFNLKIEFLDELTRAYENPEKFLKEFKQNKTEVKETNSTENSTNKRDDLTDFIRCVNLLEDSTTSNYRFEMRI